MFLFVVIVAGGIREELQRAFLLHRFRGDLGRPWMGVLITSLAFGLGHTLQGLDAAIITGSLGALWGVMYLARQRDAPIVSHSLFNSSELLRVFLKLIYWAGSTTSVRRRRSATQSATSSARRYAINRSRTIGAACSNVCPACRTRHAGGVHRRHLAVARQAGRCKALREVRLRAQVVANPGAQPGLA